MRFLLLLVLLVSAGDLHAQHIKENIVGEKSGYWQFMPRYDFHDSVVAITTSSGSATGVVVKVLDNKPIADGMQGYAITSAHVVKDQLNNQESIKIQYINGKSKNNRIIAIDDEADLALLWVWVPNDVNAIEIADSDEGVFFHAAGLGGNSPLRKLRSWRGFRKLEFPSNDKVTYFDSPASPGDSGGIVLSRTNKLVGVISGGWLWFEDKWIRDVHGNPLGVTYPVRTSSLKSIKEIMKEIE